MTSCAVCGARRAEPFLAENGYAIVRCAGCGLRYLDPQPSAEAIAALYDESYFHSEGSVRKGYGSYDREADNLRATFRDRLRFLPKACVTGGGGRRLLDVGAAAGFFVEQARLAGWDAEGIEPSAWASGYARERLGLPVQTGTLDEAGHPDGAFDAVTCWEVIEHVADPRALCAAMARLLKPGGRLLLSTPDAGSAVATLSGRRWLGWRKVPEHLFFFDRRALRRLLREAGLVVTGERYVSLTVTAGFAVERLGALIGLPLGLPASLARLPLRVNPLYDLLVIAERRDRVNRS